MNRILIFDENISGHHLEYIKNLHQKAIHTPNAFFIFAVPEKMKEVDPRLAQSQHANISFRFLSQDECVNKKGRISAAWHGCRLIRKIVNETKTDFLFIILLVRYMPFLPFFVSKRTAISGIIYNIYLYNWKHYSSLQKAVNLLLYGLYRYGGNFHKLFILNDQTAVYHLNRIWKTGRYAYLVDPYNGIEDAIVKKERSQTKLTFLHFGSLARRKGTIDILHALTMLSKDEQQKIHVIFAGHIQEEIRKEFYLLTDELRHDVEFEIYDEFVSYKTIEELCSVSDYILIPYKNTAQSSGLIAYAAKYSVPVIGPKAGLLGRLIKKYGLGILLDNSDGISICHAIQNALKTKPYKAGNTYLASRTVDRFGSQIVDGILS